MPAVTPVRRVAINSDRLAIVNCGICIFDNGPAMGEPSTMPNKPVTEMIDAKGGSPAFARKLRSATGKDYRVLDVSLWRTRGSIPTKHWPDVTKAYRDLTPGKLAKLHFYDTGPDAPG